MFIILFHVNPSVCLKVTGEEGRLVNMVWYAHISIWHYFEIMLKPPANGPISNKIFLGSLDTRIFVKIGKVQRKRPKSSYLLGLVINGCVRTELCTLLSDQTLFMFLNMLCTLPVKLIIHSCLHFIFMQVLYLETFRYGSHTTWHPLWMKPLPFHQYLVFNFLNLVYYIHFRCRLNSFTFINFMCEIWLNLSLLDVFDSWF